MGSDDEEEEKRLRSVALQTANSILLARQRAERELLEAKSALERKTEELAHSLAMLRATLESTTDAILVTDATGHVTGHNRKFAQMWGFAAESITSREHREIMEVTSAHFDDPASFRSRLEQIDAVAPPETYDLLELADGRVIERFSKTQQIDQRSVGRVWSFRDITERRKGERDLHEQSEWFRVTLGSIGDAVITVDTACRITFLNPVAERLTAWTSSSAAGKPVEEVMRIVNENTRERVESPIHLALETGGIVGLANHTTLIRHDESEIPIEDSAAPIKSPTGATIGAVMVFHDVTERRQKESALVRSYHAEQEARSAAEQANLAKDHFLAALSHELRTPLTPVLAILSSLRQEALPTALAEDLETVRRNVELEARLIDDLLDLTRISRGKLHLHHERISANVMIEDAIKTCCSDLQARRLTLHRHLAEPAPTIEADSARVTQILWNLLKNSVKFTPPEGTITISSQVAARHGTDELIIEVRDTGIGLERGDLERIFRAFEQGDSTIAQRFGGLGLGLAISKAIAESHGGTLSAASEGRGHGSTFTLTLPCVPAPDQDAPPAQWPRPSPSAPLRTLPERPLRILFVEDHSDTAAVLSRLLRRMGHEVFHAPGITVAREIASREFAGAGIDLLISDLGLPDGRGQDLMHELATRYALTGIALSGYGMDTDLEQTTAAGFARHLTKPVDIAALQRAIAEVVFR